MDDHGYIGYCSLDRPTHRNYLDLMNIIRRTLEIDAGTDARLSEMAAERGQDVAAVLADAVALLIRWSIRQALISQRTGVGSMNT